MTILKPRRARGFYGFCHYPGKKINNGKAGLRRACLAGQHRTQWPAAQQMHVQMKNLLTAVSAAIDD